jgi:hypothetical protein
MVERAFDGLHLRHGIVDTVPGWPPHQKDCPNPAGHYRTVLLPVEPTEWGKILSAAYTKGFRLVEIVQPTGSGRSCQAITAIVEHCH